MRVIRQQDYRVMPWKNGSGETTEIFVSPSTGGFDWRVSIATVNQDGPFSAFKGYDRHIMVLSGKGMALDIAGHEKIKLELLVPHSFSGDAQVNGSLVQGPVLDFNLIVRRSFGRGSLRVSDCEAAYRLGPSRSLHLVHFLQGSCNVGNIQLDRGDSICLGEGEQVDLPTAAKFAICEITPH